MADVVLERTADAGVDIGDSLKVVRKHIRKMPQEAN